MSEIIQLSDDLIIGTGRDRICYEHPTIKNQCIKISISSHKQSRREVRYFSFLKKRNTDLSHVSVFTGKIQTNKGTGFCFELIRDINDKVSPTLREALEQQKTSVADIRYKLKLLKEYLINNRICVRDVSPSNIIYQTTPQGVQLIIIDGISNANTNPLTIRIPKLITSAITKAWESLERKLTRIEKTMNKTVL